MDCNMHRTNGRKETPPESLQNSNAAYDAVRLFLGFLKSG